MDAILEFKVHAIIRDIDLKPSEHDVENAIKEMLYENFNAVEISELAVRYEGEEDEQI